MYIITNFVPNQQRACSFQLTYSVQLPCGNTFTEDCGKDYIRLYIKTVLHQADSKYSLQSFQKRKKAFSFKNGLLWSPGSL